MKRIIEKGFELYRLDLVEPPENWSLRHKSKLYDNYSEEGAKNSIGAFFFFSSSNEVYEYDTKVRQDFKDRIDETILNGTHWITETSITDDITMLDLTGIKDITALCQCLHNDEIDIFKDNFWHRRNFFWSKPLSDIIDDVELVCINKANKDEVEESKNNINRFFGYDFDQEDFSYIFQELTDFTNGGHFKKLLLENECEGYIFKEFGCTTYCFLESTKLECPQHSILICNQ